VIGRTVVKNILDCRLSPKLDVTHATNMGELLS
jgi:hypothetical protein